MKPGGATAERAGVVDLAPNVTKLREMARESSYMLYDLTSRTSAI